MELAFLFAAALLLAGLIMRVRLRILQTLYVPASLSGGLLGLLLIQAGYGMTESSLAVSELADQLASQLKTWPGWLIAVVFAGLFLDKPVDAGNRSAEAVVSGTARQANMVWIICLGQVAAGLLVAWLLVEPLQLAPFAGDVPPYFGQLIEAGFVGGHGTSAALGDVYEKMGYAGAKDLAFFMATIGLVYSVLSGIVLVNLAVRRGWTHVGNVKIPALSGLEIRQQGRSLGTMKVDPAVLDPLVFQTLILAVAFAVGLLLQWCVSWAYDGLPLFMFTLLGGWCVREVMKRLGMGTLIDPLTIRRLVAAAMEFLIVAAVASLDLTLVVQAIIPLTLLLLAGFVWTAVCLLVLSRRLLPSAYWFELGVINYGMSTGVTASGLMLLRIIDKEFESGAAEDYALAAPLSSPFVGGGIVTLVVYPAMLTQLGVGVTAIAVTCATLALIGLGVCLARGDAAGRQAGAYSLSEGNSGD